jgi:LAO/AO transport system kinase
MHDLDALFAALRSGDRAALGRAITLVESQRESDRTMANDLVSRCMPYSGAGLRLGITGIPGAGKSTLIEALGNALIDRGHRVAVLAIDPSSARTGGSILGDKTRMERLSQRTLAFIRPSPTGGHLGGVAHATRETIILCEAAGYDHVIVETVGAGQSELEVDGMTDLNVLLLIAGAGDELQGMKRGIMESADVIVFNKADGDAKVRAENARRELRGVLDLLPLRPSGRKAELLVASAQDGSGIDELRSVIAQRYQEDRASGSVAVRRAEQSLHWLDRAIDLGLRDLFQGNTVVQQRMAAVRDAVRNGSLSPFAAAEELLVLFRTGGALRP